MARKKQEVALQAEIETQEEWEEMLAKEGLTVVDTYQEWAGPCKAMVSNFRRLKNELGDDLLRFTVAKTDTVDALERYRGKCEPCFLFFAGGVLVAQVRGANSPLLLRTITEQLAYEHKVLEGTAERKEIKDPLLADVETDKDEEEEEEGEEGLQHKGERIIFESLPEVADQDGEEERKKTVTVAIIKPNVVADGRVDEVIEQMKESGIEILEQEERQMSEEDARRFYAHKEGEEYFEDMIKYMTSGPCHILVITKGETGDGIIDEWRDLLGPSSMEEAMENAPESLRAKYGRQESYINALHGSDSEETAMRELAFFFPDYNVPTVPRPGKKPKVQRTLALIRPDALRERKEEILAKIEESGFKVALQKEVRLSKEQAKEFYKEHEGEEYFETLTDNMSSGPLLALGLAREDAVTSWRDLLGPKELEKAKQDAPESLRAQFSVEDVPFNQLHGSDSEDTAQKELEYFFPMQQTVAVIKPDAYQTKDEIMQRVREAGFHIAARKETELTKEIAEQFYRDQNGKEYYGDLIDHMTSGPTLFMVLSREDAVDGWRSLIGPTDPEKAKEENEQTLRAQFGTDVKSNAIHGSSNPDHASETMKLIFGELEFNADGTVKKGSANQSEAKQQKEQPQGEEQQQSEQQGEESEQTEQQQHSVTEADDAEGEEDQAEGQAATEDAEQTTEQTDQPTDEQTDEQRASAEETASQSGEQKEDGTSQKEASTLEGQDPEGEKKEDEAQDKDEDQKAEEETAGESQQEDASPEAGETEQGQDEDHSPQEEQQDDTQQQQQDATQQQQQDDTQQQQQDDTQQQHQDDTQQQHQDDTQQQQQDDTQQQQQDDTQQQQPDDTQQQQQEDSTEQAPEEQKQTAPETEPKDEDPTQQEEQAQDAGDSPEDKKEEDAGKADEDQKDEQKDEDVPAATSGSGKTSPAQEDDKKESDEQQAKTD